MDLKGLTAVVDLGHMQAVIAAGVQVDPLGLPLDIGQGQILGVFIPTTPANVQAMRKFRSTDVLTLSADQCSKLREARAKLTPLPIAS